MGPRACKRQALASILEETCTVGRDKDDLTLLLGDLHAGGKRCGYGGEILASKAKSN